VSQSRTLHPEIGKGKWFEPLLGKAHRGGKTEREGKKESSSVQRNPLIE
jgi:hypothetical protein